LDDLDLEDLLLLLLDLLFLLLLLLDLLFLLLLLFDLLFLLLLDLDLDLDLLLLDLDLDLDLDLLDLDLDLLDLEVLPPNSRSQKADSSIRKLFVSISAMPVASASINSNSVNSTRSFPRKIRASMV